MGKGDRKNTLKMKRRKRQRKKKNRMKKRFVEKTEGMEEN